ILLYPKRYSAEPAGQRVMESVTHFITHRLKLKVNQTKSAAARPRQRKFLGFSFTGEREPRRRIGDGQGSASFANGASVGPSLIRRTAVCGPACTVVWQGRVGDHFPYADCGVELVLLAACEGEGGCLCCLAGRYQDCRRRLHGWHTVGLTTRLRHKGLRLHSVGGCASGARNIQRPARIERSHCGIRTWN